MGQYYILVNLTKKEFLHPHKFGDGLKLMEFGLSEMGTMSGLAILLADGNGRGGGDINEDPITNIVGRWKGNRIVIAGDYADEGRFVTEKEVKGLKDDKGNPVDPKKVNLYHVADEKYKDISYDVLFALMADSDVRDEMKGGFTSNDNIIKDFKKIHKALANYKDLPLLIGHLKTDEGKGKLEQLLKTRTS